MRLHNIGVAVLVLFLAKVPLSPHFCAIAQSAEQVETGVENLDVSEATDSSKNLDRGHSHPITAVSSEIFHPDEESKEVFDELLQHLNALLDKGKMANEVIDTLNKQPSEIVATLPYQICLARSYVQVGRHDEAENILQILVRDYPSSAEASRLLGSYYVQKQRFNEAEKYLRDTLALEPGNWKALAGLGKVYLLRDDDKIAAKTNLQRAIEIQPGDENLRFEFAMILFHFDDHRPAKEALESAELLNPDIDHKLIAKIYLHYKHIDWAAVELRKVVGAMPATAWVSSSRTADTEAMLLLAECSEILGQTDSAKKLYEEVISLQPHNVLAHAGIGLLLLGTGSGNVAAVNACGLNHAEAMSHFSTCLSLEDRTKLPSVASAADFCLMELEEVQQWRDIVQQEKQKALESVVQGPVVSVVRRVGSDMHLLSEALRPLGVIKRAGRSLLRGVLTAAGVCNDMLLGKRKVDFSGVVGLITQSMQHACMPSPPSSSDTTAREKTAQQGKKIKQRREAEDEMRKMWASRSSLQQLPRVAVHSAEELYTQYVLKNRPVIITNFQNSWADSSVFTKERLSEKFENSTVRVSISESGRFDGPESGSLWGLDPRTDVLVRPPATSMRFQDFVALTSTASNNQSARAVERERVKETFYLEYLALSQYLGKPFLDLIPQPEQTLSADYPMEHLVTNLWIGTKSTVSPLHYDDYENLLCQIKGNKELVLFPPSDLPNLYYTGRPKGTLEYKYPGTFTRNISSITRHSVVFGSSVNVDSPNLTAHPLYAQASPIRALLNPGDVLYLPAYWHHEVQSLPDPLEQLNIAVNFWFKNVTYPIDDHDVLGINR